MSLLEDIFLRDEADEARELERIIEGDEYEEKHQQRSDSDDNSEKEDEAEEEKKRVDPSTTKTKRAVRNPRFILNPARLTGPRGIQVIPEHFKDFKFKGKGHEKEDMDLVLKKLEHWAYRLYPKFQFEDCLKKIETLGKKRPVMVHLQKIRSDQYVSEETVVQKDSSDEESAPVEREEDEFDKLLQQQIELARSTPGPGSVRKPALETTIMDSLSITAPKATSSPSISEEQKERMMRNRKLAEERRLARLKNNSNLTESAENTISDPKSTEITINLNDISETDNKKNSRSNIIDSSDDEEGITMVNESITVDIHTEVNMTVRHKKNRIEDNRNSDFDSILTEDNERKDDSESQNEVGKENEINNTTDQSKCSRNRTPTKSVESDGIMTDLDNKTTDNEDNNIEKDAKLVDNGSTSNKNTENLQNESEENVPQTNEDINSRVESTKDTNSEVMDVDFGEDF